MGGPLSIHSDYVIEDGTRLSPVQEERLREAIRTVELECFRLDLPKDFPRLIDAWITKTPPSGSTYAASAYLILRSTSARPRVRAKKRRIWLPWRRGGGRG